MTWFSTMFPIRTRQRIRIVWHIFAEQSIAPLYDPLSRIHIISIPFFLVIVFFAMGPKQVTEEALLTWVSARALWYALPVFLLWNLIAAIFGAKKAIANKGQWIGSRFVFVTPVLVCTSVFDPKDDGKHIQLTVNDAEPNTIVSFKMEYDGGTGVAAIGVHFDLPIHGFGVQRPKTYKARIDNKRRSELRIKIPKDSDQTIVRVYAISWEV